MASYKDYGLTASDLEADEGATRARQQFQLAKAIGDVSGMAAAKQAFVARFPVIAAKKQTGPLEAGLVSAGSAATGLGQGAQMIAGKLIGDKDMVDNAAAAMAEREHVMDPLKKAYPEATAIGSMLPGMAVPGGVGPGLASRALTSGIASAGLTALESGGEAPVEQLMASGVLGAAGNEASRFIGRGLVGAPRNNPEFDSGVHNRQVEMARDYGVRLTPGQLAGNSAQLQTEAGLKSKPWTSKPFLKIEEHNQGLMNKTLRQELGMSPSEEPIDDISLEQISSKIGEDIAKHVGNDKLFYATTDLFDAADEAKSVVSRGILRDPAGERLVDNVVDRFGTRARRKPVTVSDYQQTRSDLAALDRTSNDPTMRRVIRRMKDAIDAEFEKTFPSSGELSDLRRRYAVLKNIERSKSLQSGEFSPLKYYNYQRHRHGHVVGSDDTNKRPLEDLASIAHFFRDTVPNSGTATRSAVADFANASNINRMLMLGGNAGSAAYIGMRHRYPILPTSPYPIPDVVEIMAPRFGREAIRKKSD